MNMYFAHAEDQHTEETSELVHNFTQWYASVPLFFLALTAILFIAWKFLHFNPPQLMLLSMAIFFLVGVLSFSVVSVLSIICLSLGIALALFFTLVSIAK